VASGLSLVFGVLGVLNFAHGSFYMYGAFFVFTWDRLQARRILAGPVDRTVRRGDHGRRHEIVFLRPIYKATRFTSCCDLWPSC